MDAESPPAKPPTVAQGLLALLGLFAAVLVAIGVRYQVMFIDVAATMAGFFLLLVLAPATFLVALLTMIAVAGFARSLTLKVIAGVYFFGAMALSVSMYFLDNPHVKGFFEAMHVSRPAGKPKPEPLTPPNMAGRTAGAEWARSNGVTDEAICERARNREFREGCTHYARRQKSAR